MSLNSSPADLDFATISTPETALWSAVVLQAIKDMDSPIAIDRAQAMGWLDSDETGVGSMRWICDMLDLDYNRILFLTLSRDGRKRILQPRMWALDQLQ